MKSQHHLVFDAGLIGGFLAANLQLQGVNVGFIGRGIGRERLLKNITLTDVDGNRAETQALTEWDLSEQADVIWLTVKCTGLAQAIEEMRPLLHKHTTIVCCQNGLGGFEQVSNAFPNHELVHAIAVYNVAPLGEEDDQQLASTHLHRGTDGKLMVDGRKLPAAVLEALSSDLQPLEAHDNIEGVIWSKLQMNLINALNAVSNLPVLAMLMQRGYRQLYADMMAELPAVASANNVHMERLTKLPQNISIAAMRMPDWLFTRVALKSFKVDESTRTSMWWDLKGQRKTEIDYIQGALVKSAKAHGLQCPVNETVANLIRAIEAGEEAWGLSAEAIRERANAVKRA